MYCVYVLLEDNSNKTYIGYTNNLKQRLQQHKSTKNMKLIYYEAYTNEKQARDRERRLKMYGSAWRELKKRLKIPLATRLEGGV